MARAAATSERLDMGLLLEALIAFQKGDFSVRLPVDRTGMAGKVADTLNSIFETNERLRDELSRVSNEVGKEGQISSARPCSAPPAIGTNASNPSMN